SARGLLTHPTLGEALRAPAFCRYHPVVQPRSDLHHLPRARHGVSRGCQGCNRRCGRRLRMQLNVIRHRLLTLLFLSVCATPAVTGVLPDDRTDAMYHRYEGGGITIQGPDILVQKKITDNFALTGSWYQDYISSASIDVKLSASPYKEKRTQETGGVMYLHRKSTYSAGLIHSDEPDYKANTTYYSVSQDMFGDLTTLSLTYKRGWDKIYRDLKDANGQIINDPSFGG